MNTSNGNVIHTQGLPKAYKGVQALHGLNLEVPAGVAAHVTLSSCPQNVETEGLWMANRGTYIADGAGASWAIDIEMGVGNLTLVSQ
ncbi:MAG TPA: hypothetical protein VGD99_12830 [Anaerolineae bacterium]